MLISYKKSLFAALFVLFCLTPGFAGENVGNSGSVEGTVQDSTGAVVAHATVEIRNPVSGYDHSTTTDAQGKFSFTNIPFNPYHLTVVANGFAPYVEDVEPRSAVPITLSITLQVVSSTTTVNVQAEGGDLVETDSTFHTDVDKSLFDKLPLESQSSSVSSLVTLSTPGIAADSNGLFHGLGDHAENSFVVDGQPITDQQSKVFSNQIPLDSIQSMEVIAGAPPAEYGDKTSVVINVTTQSGQGMTQPHGAVTASYGSFGTSLLDFNLGYGKQNWGNFISASGLNTGRFLDPPEFTVMHDKGNEENVFDRVDYQISSGDSIHLNLGYTRSWFQNPNSFDSQDATAWSGATVDNGGLDPFGDLVGPADQRSQIKTFNISPSWTRLISTTSVFTLGAWVRRDQYNYYPSGNPFADLAPDLQAQTVGQNRTLTNAGLRSDISYVKGIHNLKAGVTYEQTLLNENDMLGIVDPTFNAPCLDANNNPVWIGSTPSFPNDPSQCAGAGLQPNIASNPNAASPFNPLLGCYDLTRPTPSGNDGCPASASGLFGFNGHTDVKELALYVEDNITKGNWALNLGLRGDLYNGLSTHKEAEPRLGVAYNIKRSNTVLRASYARTLETPFNENLILSSEGCGNPVLNPLLLCATSGITPLSPGWRNEFHVGIQQAFGRYVVFSGEYIWKYTHNAYDFSVLGSTPVTFPIEWDRSKIPGYAGRVSVPTIHGFSALMVFSSVAARFFAPQIGGAGASPTAPGGVFRIDHDEKFNQTTHIQYQPWKRGPWVGFNWRYDSGLVAGSVPCAGGESCNNGPLGSATLVDTSVISADQQFQAGLFCGSLRATPTHPLPTPCPASQFGSSLITIPAPGTENDDHNPPRIAPRHLFDLAVGHDNLFNGDKYKVSLQLTAINITNKYALYNFLSTFSGTHYVSPRALTAELGFHF
ncbi:MAG TPA: TonB-dependent receptor [Candidatus Aquilonibacter sp.]|nr:TonB-dependent receptor [Candidatus Aquilonibacter sp.]